mmetsp:Transcript_28589/g.40934  ORF Transcript_28589/g.40934 Transcript_28589/m.40934 type:complete len:287 (+) Transcript_28589:305-1165(+)
MHTCTSMSATAENIRLQRRRKVLMSKRPARFTLAELRPLSEKRKCFYQCFFAVSFLLWLLPFLGWLFSGPGSIDWDSTGKPSDLHLRRAAMKEYHHHVIKQEVTQSLKNQTASIKSFDRNSFVASGNDNRFTVGDHLQQKASSLILQHQIVDPESVKQDLSSISSKKSNSNAEFTVEHDLGNTGQFEEIDKELKKAQQQLVLSRSHRLSSRIGCNWRRGSSALKLEIKASFSEKIINTARRANIWKGDIHPHIVLHDKVGETKAWSAKDKLKKSVSEVYRSGRRRL